MSELTMHVPFFLLTMYCAYIHAYIQGFENFRHAGLVALISTDAERVAPMFARLAFDTSLAFGTRLEVKKGKSR